MSTEATAEHIYVVTYTQYDKPYASQTSHYVWKAFSKLADAKDEADVWWKANRQREYGNPVVARHNTLAVPDQYIYCLVSQKRRYGGDMDHREHRVTVARVWFKSGDENVVEAEAEDGKMSKVGAGQVDGDGDERSSVKDEAWPLKRS